MWSSDLTGVDKDSIIRTVILKDEKLNFAWRVLRINKHNGEQDRIIILTNKAFYRVTYQYQQKKIVKFARFPVSDVTSIQVGLLKIGDEESFHFGIRVFITKKVEDESFLSKLRSKDSHGPFFHTYKPFGLSPLETGKEICEEIAQKIIQARSPLVPNSNELLEEMHVKFIVCVAVENNDPISKLKDAFGVGSEKERRKTISTASPSLTSSANKLAIDIPKPPPVPSPAPSGSPILPPEALFGLNSQTAVLPAPTTRPVVEIPPQKISKPAPSKPLPLRPPPAKLEPQSPSKEIPSSGSSSSVSNLLNSSSASTIRSRHKSDNNISQLLKQIEIPPMSPAPPLSSSQGSLSSSQEIPAPPKVEQNFSQFLQSLHHYYHGDEDLANVIGDDAPFLYRLFNRMDRMGHFGLLIALSFAFGYFNFSFLWALIFIFVAFKIDNIRQEKLNRMREKDWRKTHQHLETTIKKPTETNKPDPESCNWFNAMFKELWKEMNGTVAEATREKLIELLEYYLNQKKPTGVENMIISEIKFGDVPPMFKSVQGFKPPFPDYRMDFDVMYLGPAQIILEVVVGGSKVNVKMPILLTDFDIKGRMRFDMTFFARSPFLNNLSFAFIEMPSIDISIKPLKALDIMEIPFLKESIADSLKALVMSNLVLPTQISLPYTRIFGHSGPSKQVSDSNTQRKSQSTGNLQALEDGVRQDNIERHQAEIERSISDGDFGGLMHVRVLEGRRFLTEYMRPNSTPYVILSSGPHEVFSTKAVKRAKNPAWNEFFELLVKKNQKEQKLEITCMARDTVNGDDFMGQGLIEFKELANETRDFWVPLERTSKRNPRGSAIIAGEVHLQVRFVIANALEDSSVH